MLHCIFVLSFVLLSILISIVKKISVKDTQAKIVQNGQKMISTRSGFLKSTYINKKYIFFFFFLFVCLVDKNDQNVQKKKFRES